MRDFHFSGCEKQKYSLIERLHKGATIFLREIKEYLSIYTWTELWMVVGASLGLMGIWYLFSLQLRIQNDVVRMASIWTLIFMLTAGAAATDWLRKRKA